MPTHALAALRAAFDETMQDPLFLAEAEKMDLPVAGAAAEKIIETIYAAPPPLIARAQDVVGR